ncbi:calcineurin-binding protein cabin-1-like [Glandiceps talaboti]
MIRIAALNNASSDESNSDDEVQESTKEAQEAEAFALYNKALSLQRAGKLEEAQDVYQKLLQSTLIIKESAGTITTGEGVVRPGLILKYSAMKNLASLASEKHDLHTAMKYYLKAVELDCSDVTVWYHMGKIAVELSQLSLARLAFEEALTCNPNHWPAMDSLCSVLYALSDYYSCMYYISKALGRDGSYTKGLVLRDKMYQEQPSLKRECEPLFQSNEFTNYDQKYSKDEADKIVNEAVDIRNKRKEQIKPPEIPVLKFEKPLTSLTWKCLGERLVSLYDLVDSKKPTLSFGHHVDLSYQVTDTQIDTVIDLSMDTSTPMDITASASVQPVEQTVSTCTSSITSTVASATSITSTTTMTKTTNITSTPIPSPSRQQDHRQGKQKEEEPMETEIDSSSGTEKSKRGPKRKRGVVASDDTPAAKRRSQRVRNTTKKKEEAINYKELLRQFLPSSLRESEDEDEDDDNKVTDSNNTLELIREHEAASCTTPGSKKQDSTAFIMTEENDVTAFLDKYSNNNGIVDLMIQYCIALAQRCNSKWPGGLTGVYIEVYKKLRVHLSLPSYYCKSVNNQRIKEVSLVSLVYTELQLEKWLATKLMSPVSPNTMQSNLSADKSQLLLPSDPDDVFPSDLQYLEGLCHLKDILNDSRLQFAIRVYWLKSRYLMLQGKMESALDCFDICSQLLKPEKAESLPVVPVVVRLPNCKDDIITSEQVKKQLESLQRCQSLEEVHRLSEMGDYRKVVDLLLPTLSQPATKGKMMDVGKTIPERPAQLLLLLDALYQIQNYTLCVSCSVNTLNECIQQLTSSSTMTIKENWVATLTKVLKFVDKCISGSGDIISGMSRTKIVNLTNHVIRMIELAMESTDSPELPVISTIVPWVLLYRLIKHEEDQLTLIQVSEQGSTDEMGAGSGSSKDIKIMPSSLMLLYTAHEYLGRRGWCCNSDGNLLTFYVDTLQEELGKREEKDPLRQDLLLALEQCFYCLYGHPNRKAKARHLQDHGVEEVILTWDKAVFVFDYFKPKTVPEFDSYKTSSMSGELENLLLKISKVIPNPDNIAISLDTVMAYIEGTADQVPTIPQDKPVSL